MSSPPSTKQSKRRKQTPLMIQYQELKQKHPDAILLFQVGDFYETFGQDAVRTAEVLGIVLTHRNNGGSNIELAGFPHHSLEMYLPRLVRAGHRVAICQQMEKPSKEKKIVRRDVTEIVTPGVTQSDALLDRSQNNFLASLYKGAGNLYGISLLDISTGEFLISEGHAEHLANIIESMGPVEIIYPKDQKEALSPFIHPDVFPYGLDGWVYSSSYAPDLLKKQFQVSSLKGFGIDALSVGQIAAGSILHYLDQSQQGGLRHIRSIQRIEPDAYVWLDSFTIRNLELVHALHPQGKSLLDILDDTLTPMGARLLRRWVVLPSKNLSVLRDRQAAVAYAQSERDGFCKELSEALRSIHDLERLVSKISSARIHPRECIQLRHSLEIIQPIRDSLIDCPVPSMRRMADILNPCQGLTDRIAAQLLDEPASVISKGGVFRDDATETLYELRHTIQNAQDLLLELQQREAEATGINSLKIGFNNVFGYYLEVTNKYKNSGLVPEHWVRKQTLTNAERYISDELKQLEDRILHAQERALELEQNLYEELIYTASEYLEPIQKNATLLAELDVLLSFSRIAQQRNYIPAELSENRVLHIQQGRHPVIEAMMPLGEPYIPNDVLLSPGEQQILMITGPNMSGKSAILRQTALICLMAQLGCPVPAESAQLGIVDRIFTRVGASDNISSGESTFMVEMNETASIMNNLSDRSLILLDEIGRGTSTYDGISIAWSIAEYLHEHPTQPKTLFATHYHELNALAERFTRIKNYHVATREADGAVLFLRTLKEGGSEHSFGIHVAQMAGMPHSIISRAQETLRSLEASRLSDEMCIPSSPGTASSGYQLQMFSVDHPEYNELKKILDPLDVNRMTPVECMLKIQELKNIIKAGS